MPSYNPSNERIKRQYFVYVQEADRCSEATVDSVAAALSRFEAYTGYKDFKKFHHGQAIAFKRRLAGQRGVSGEVLSKSTLHSTLTHLKRFFRWLAGQPGFKSRFTYSDADYFNLSEKDSRVATARRDREPPTLEQIRQVLAIMPELTDIGRRNRALIAFAVLSGARDSAIASLKLKHVDLKNDQVHQDAREVKTKASKTLTTDFFPVGSDIRGIVVAWVTYLREERGWGNADPLFPATQVSLGPDRQFAASGLKREHWKSSAPIRAIFSQAFRSAGLEYFNPHSLRRTLARLGQCMCRTPEDFKAWSQNLGHEEVLTTFRSYGSVDPRRQRAILRGLSESTAAGSSLAQEVAEFIELRQRNQG
jgi:integrase